MRMSIMRWPAVVLAALVAIVSLVPLPPNSARAISQDNMVYLGAWVGEQVNVPGDVSVFEQAVGKKMAIIHRYHSNLGWQTTRFDTQWADAVRSHGSIPMLSWEPGFDLSGTTLEMVAQGGRDEFIVSWADQLRDWGKPIFLRIMWEQNASWFKWRADREPQTTNFVYAWRHIVELFRAEGATNVTFVWSPHVDGNGAGPIMDTFPGEDYVDWVALDGYPYRGGRTDFYSTFKSDYDLLTTQVNRPLMIAETSLESWSDEIKAGYIRDILEVQLPTNFPRVKALVWFDEKNTSGTNFSILTKQGPLSREAFKDGVSSSYYASNYFGGLTFSPIPLPELVAVPPSGDTELPTPTSTSQPSVPSATSTSGAVAATSTATHTSTPSSTPMSAATSTATSTVGAPTSTATASQTPFVAPTVLPAEANLLSNPSFSDGLDGAGEISGWLRSAWSRSITSVSPEAAVDGDGAGLSMWGEIASYVVYQDIQVRPGDRYSFAGAINVAERRNGAIKLEVVPLNRYGGTIQTAPISRGFFASTNGWQSFQIDAVMPSGTAVARVQIKADSFRGLAYVDGLSFFVTAASPPSATASPTITSTPKPSATLASISTATATATVSSALATPSSTAVAPGGNMLANGSFQPPLSSRWTVTSWAASMASISDGAAYDGEGAGLLERSEGTTYIVYQEVPAVAGQSYQLAGMSRIADLRGGAFRIELVAMNVNNGTIGPPISKSYVKSTQGWEPFSIDAKLPDGASRWRVQFKSDGMRGAAHIDAVSLMAK